ncbi:MAG: hypothetical protein IBX61_01170 [Thermoleophilia bacterium]|nr:hypothetical protein [Thermoleophilia bacterium]
MKSNQPTGNIKHVTPHGRFRGVLFLPALAILLLAVSFTAAGCGGDSASDDGAVAEADPASTEAKPVFSVTEADVAELAGRRIGEKNLIRSVQITSQGNDKDIVISVSRPSACHDGAVVGIGVTFAQKMMARLFKYPEVASVETVVYGTDENTPNDEVALRIVVDRSVAAGMDWFEFTDRNAPRLATTYYAHPKIQSSYDIEGGDPSGPVPQGQTPSA